MYTINIKATNIELTEALREYSERKLGGIEKFVKGGKGIEYFQLELAKTTNHHKNGDIFRAEVTATISGDQFYAFSEQADLYAAIDDVHEGFVREVTTSRGRARELFRRGARSVKKMLKGISSRNPFTSK